MLSVSDWSAAELVGEEGRLAVFIVRRESEY